MLQRALSWCLMVAFANVGMGVKDAYADSSHTQNVRLRASSPPVSLRLGTSDLGVTLTAQDATLQIPLQAPVSMAVRSVKLDESSDRYVGIVRLTSSAASYVALLVAPNTTAKWLWSGRVDFHGDPGERTRFSVQAAKHNGHTRVYIKEQREGVRICEQALAAVSLRQINPANLSLDPVTLPRLPPAMLHNATKLDTQPLRPDVLIETPRVQLLQRNAALQYPSDFVSMHFQSVHWPIEALHIKISERPPAEAELFIIGDNSTVFRVQLAAQGKRNEYWLVFKSPLRWRCMSLVQTHSALNLSSISIRAYTALDRQDGLDRLLTAWRGGKKPADEATSLLKRWGTEVVSALLGLWPKLDPFYRRSAVEIWTSYAAQHPLAIEALAHAAQDPSAKVQRAAIDGLFATQELSVEHLTKLSLANSAQGDRVALWLSDHYPEQALAALLNAFAVDGGEDRSALRDALVQSLSQVPFRAAEQDLATWYASNPRIGARAAVIAVLSRFAQHRARAHQWLQATYPNSQHFADQWRLVQSSAVMPEDAALDRWLTELALNAEPWMLRAAAWRTLTLRHPRNSQLPVTKALTDAYPMVRQQAIQALMHELDRSIWPHLQARLNDSGEWPSVRHAALDYVLTRCELQGAESVLRILRQQSARPASRLADRLAWHALSVALTLDPQTRQQALAFLAQSRFRTWATKAAKVKVRYCQPPGNL